MARTKPRRTAPLCSGLLAAPEETPRLEDVPYEGAQAVDTMIQHAPEVEDEQPPANPSPPSGVLASLLAKMKMAIEDLIRQKAIEGDVQTIEEGSRNKRCGERQ